MALYGIKIDGVSSDSEFKINGQPYTFDLIYDSKSNPYWRVNTETRTIKIVNPKDYDEVHRVLLAAQLEYHSDKSDHPLWQQLYKALKELEEQRKKQSQNTKELVQAA